MLRASIEYHGRDGDLRALTEGAQVGDAGMPHGALLTRFAEAAVRGEEAELGAARAALLQAAGPEAMVDAAGVIANFQRMVRIADGTGIALDDVVVGASQDFRAELGLEKFRSRRLQELGPVGRVAAPALRRLAGLGLRLAGLLSRRPRA